MTQDATAVLTAADIARRLGTPLHRVAYLLRSRDVQPIRRAGNIRLFAESDSAFIRGELARIEADREGLR